MFILWVGELSFSVCSSPRFAKSMYFAKKGACLQWRSFLFARSRYLCARDVHACLLERIVDNLNSVHRRNGEQVVPPYHHRAQVSLLRGQHPLVGWVSQRLLDRLQHQVHQLVVALQDPLHLASTNELDAHRLVPVLGQIQDGLPLGPVVLLGVSSSVVVFLR